MSSKVAASLALPRLDSKTILEQKSKLDTLVDNAKQQILELKEDIQSGAGLCDRSRVALDGSPGQRWFRTSFQSGKTSGLIGVVLVLNEF